LLVQTILVIRLMVSIQLFNPRRRRLVAAAVAGSTLAGCGPLAQTNHDGIDRPRFDSNQRGSGGIAWVFSSGGPRGFVHIGVLKALEQMQLKPDLLVGASAGSLVCALYACGIKAGELERLAMDLGALSILRLNLHGEGRFDGGGLAQLVNDRVQGKLIEQLPIPLACVAVNKQTREVVPFNCGNTGLAVQASCAIEGQFAPVKIAGQVYTDPDLVLPLPVRIARGLGARKVLAVDASAHEWRAPAGAQAYAQSDRRKRELTEPDAKAADLTLHPEFSYWVSVSSEFRQRTMQAGYAYTMAQRAKIEALYG
jgi:NTE family protein